MKRTLLTPIGVALVIVHSVVVAFAYLGDSPAPGFDNYTTLSVYLSFINIVPLIVVNLVGLVVQPLVTERTWLNTFVVLAMLLASIQWLLIGKLFQSVWENYRTQSPLLGGIKRTDN